MAENNNIKEGNKESAPNSTSKPETNTVGNYSRLEIFFKWASVIPIIIGIVYVFGFVVLSSYLWQFGYDETNILNLDYLSSGLIYTILYGSIIFILFITVKKPTDNLKQSWPEIIDFLRWLLFYFFLVSEFIFEARILQHNLIVGFSFLIALIIFTGRANSIKRQLTNYVIYFIPLLLYLYFLFKSSDIYIHTFIKSGFIFALSALVVYGNWGDKKLSETFKVTGIIIAFMYAGYFGINIYPGIPKTFGGGEPITAHFIVGQENVNLFHSLGFEFIAPNVTKAYKILYISSTNTLIQINTSNVSIRNNVYLGTIDKFTASTRSK